MTDVHRVDDLEIDQDLPYQQRTWVVERIGWGLMGAIAIAALLGLTGAGWLSQAEVGQVNDPLRLEYDRFGRYQAPQKLKVYLKQAAAANQMQLAISRQYIEDTQIEQITPEPDQIRVSSDRLIYVFEGTTPAAVTIHLRPEKAGSLSGSVELAGVQTLAFRQFIYP